jgi:hypothetical protein
VGDLPVDKMAVLKWFLLCGVVSTVGVFLAALLLFYGLPLFLHGFGQLTGIL